MPFSIRPSRHFPVQCSVRYHAGPSLTLPLAYLLGFWLLIPLLVLSSESVYAEWVLVSGYSEAGMTVYVDSETIRRKGNLVKMWELGDFRTSQKLPSGLFLSFTKQSEYDCADVRSRLLAVTSYSGNMGGGKVVVTKSDAMQWSPILPGSVEQDLWKFACGKE